MTVRKISSGSQFEADYAYSRAVVDGDWVFMSGVTGFDYTTMTISDDLVEQAEQCFDNIKTALAEAGSTLADVVRVRYLMTDGDDFSVCQPVFKKYFDTVRPAATLFVVGLLDPRMKLEIEVTAKVRR